MLIQSKEEHINFLNTTICLSVSSAYKIPQINIKFLILTQAIEILGTYFDYKPFRAKEQSSKRFEIAITKLFPQQYQKINNKNFLYYQLRNFLIHSFLPSNKVKLFENNTISNEHLILKDSVLFISYNQFYYDFIKAVEKLNFLILNDKIKLKKILY